ncbi:hypothetical protein Tco_0690600 [Tanacetum coccineum]
MPSIPSPKPAISCFDDLDFFTDFENEFLAIVYNDAQTSKLDLLTEPILNPQHIDGFDLNDKTSLSEYDEEEQNVLYFNDLFPFNIIPPDNLKSEKDNDDSKIDIILSFKDNEYTHESTTILDSKGASFQLKKAAIDAKTAIQEMAEYSQKWHNGTSRGRSTETSDGLAAIQAQLNNLGK